MKFGTFYEHQLPRPWKEGSSCTQQALDQVELADRVGIDHMWEVEHHFLEEYAHPLRRRFFSPRPASAPSRFGLATGSCCCRRLQSSGAGRPADRDARPGQQRAHRVRHRRIVGWRRVVPKPVQKPHPPIWVACSRRETIHLAAELGIGALSFAFVSPEEARQWVNDYYTTLADCVPIGAAINPNIAIVTGFMCDNNAERAHLAGDEGLKFLLLCARPSLCFRSPHPWQDRYLEELQGQPVDAARDGIDECMRRLARSAAQNAARVRGGGSRSGGVRLAGRQQQA